MGTSTFTFIIIGITSIVSYVAFSNTQLLNKLIFYPARIKPEKEWWRFITHGFIHADLTHLVFNMITLFFFGGIVEHVFEGLFGNQLVYPLFYLLALICSSLLSFEKNKNNYHYRSLGASGAVSAVLFAAIIFDPWQKLYIYFAIPIPAILFAIGYIAYSVHMSKRNEDNIGHDAHLTGALFGMIFPLVLKPQLFSYFIKQLINPPFLN